MADYFTHFSCILDVGSPENVQRALAIRDEQAARLETDEGEEIGFNLQPDPNHAPGALWIWSDGYGQPEHVLSFAFSCAQAFGLTGR